MTVLAQHATRSAASSRDAGVDRRPDRRGTASSPGTRDADDLIVRVGRALSRAHAGVAAFGEHGYTCEFEPGNSFGPEKVLAEAAMLATASAPLAASRPEVGVAWQALASLLATRARCDRVLLEIALHPGLFTKFAAPHILLTHAGIPDAQFDSKLRDLARSALVACHDETPTAAIERRWLMNCWGHDWSDSCRDDDVRVSALGRPFDLLGALREDAYAVTHVLFYVTDFGCRQAPAATDRQAVASLADTLLAKCLDVEDYDLAGELLMTRPMLSMPWSPSAAFGLDVLCHVEDTVGVLPGLSTRPERLAVLPAHQRHEYALATGYHTALVMGLLCAVAARAGDSCEPVSAPAPAGVVDTLLDRAGRDQGHWQEVAAALGAERRGELARFLFELAIAGHCRRRDYAGLHAVLTGARDLAVELAPGEVPLSTQAWELLGRLTAISAP